MIDETKMFKQLKIQLSKSYKSLKSAEKDIANRYETFLEKFSDIFHNICSSFYDNNDNCNVNFFHHQNHAIVNELEKIKSLTFDIYISSKHYQQFNSSVQHLLSVALRLTFAVINEQNLFLLDDIDGINDANLIKNVIAFMTIDCKIGQIFVSSKKSVVYHQSDVLIGATSKVKLIFFFF